MSEYPVYLDYAATTPVDPRVAEFVSQLFAENYGNASSGHAIGRQAAAHVDEAADRLAALVNCAPDRLIWTSGATESANLAIAGAARHRERHGKHLITMPTEHKAVTDMFRQLEKTGFEVTWLTPQPDGGLDLDELANALRDDTQLVSVMHVNNETGAVQDIASIGAICRERDALFHVDAAQGLGKLPIDLSALPIDLMSFTAHKLYGPKGIGALYVADRPGCHIEPLLFGGGQQRRIRPGTLPVPLIAAFGLAAKIAMESMPADLAHIAALAKRLWTGIREIDGVRLNGVMDRHVPGDAVDRHFPGIVNVSADGIEGESLLLALEPLCVATGSACTSQSQEPSAVLRALGLSDALAQSAIRFSIGRPTTAEDIDLAIDRYTEGVSRLRALAPERAA